MRSLEGYTMDERREAINQVIFSKRDRLVLELRLLDGLSYSEISAVSDVGVEVRQVGKILNRGCEKIGDYLECRNRT